MVAAKTGVANFTKSSAVDWMPGLEGHVEFKVSIFVVSIFVSTFVSTFVSMFVDGSQVLTRAFDASDEIIRS